MSRRRSERPLRVAALLSGGVDSTVAAGALRERGHDVLGVHLLLGCSGESGCGGKDSLEAAGRAAGELRIPLIVIDLREPFERLVVRPFLRGRAVGRTRNPCIACNRRLRFGLAWEKVRSLEIDALATGHYARLLDDGGAPVLARAAHPECDQSYVLAAVPPECLAVCLFPLGELRKEETRREALRRGYSCAERPSSQDLCFAAGATIAELVERRPAAGRRVRPGEIVDCGGRVLGRHDGVHRFTVGQRRGLGLAASAPHYVVAIDPTSHRVMVGSHHEARRRILRLARVSLAASRDPAIRASLATRYRATPVSAVIVARPGRRAWVFVEPPGVVAAPGQLAVWYDGERVIGSGEIR